MPQVSFTVTDDTNFTGPTRIRGVKLEELAQRLAATSGSDMVVAICDDGYRANYPHAYLSASSRVGARSERQTPARLAKGCSRSQI